MSGSSEAVKKISPIIMTNSQYLLLCFQLIIFLLLSIVLLNLQYGEFYRHEPYNGDDTVLSGPVGTVIIHLLTMMYVWNALILRISNREFCPCVCVSAQ